MGTLVFQATLGGAVNIIGPNIANTINFTLPSADGTSGQTWTTNGSGVLAFGTLGIAGGGTGQTTATAAFNALAPSQSGNSGKYLTTDGTNTSWGTNPLGDVVGPSSATDNALARFDTTTGKLIQNSVGILSDAGALSGLTDISASGAVTLSGGTANGVTYLNGSKVLTSGSALTFDGTGSFGLSASSVSTNIKVDGTGRYKQFEAYASGNRQFYMGWDNTSLVANITTDNSYPIVFSTAGTEGLRLTTTSLYTASGINVGIGTSSPAYRLDVLRNVNGANLINIDNQWGTSGASAGLQLTTADVAGSSTSTFTLQKYKNGQVSIANNETNAAANMAFTVGASERMRLDSAGNLLLGATGAYTSSFTGLTIQGLTSGTGNNLSLGLFKTGTPQVLNGDVLGNIYFYGVDNDVSAGDNNIGARIASIATTNWTTDGTTSNAALVFYTHGTTSGAAPERARFPAEGGFQTKTTISVGDATPSSSGAGITFPATQSASSDANTLDDYEEGTWQPNQGGGLTVIGAFSSSGTYTKIGRQVTFSGRIDAATSVAISAGGVICTNFPFSSAVIFTGTIMNDAATSSGGIYINGVTIVATTTFAATPSLFFSATFSV